MKGPAKNPSRKMGYWGLAVFVGLGLGTVAWLTSPSLPASPWRKTVESPQGRYRGDAGAGREIYRSHCRYCHGEKGRGEGAVAIALKPRPADFVGDTERMAASDQELFGSITKGVGVKGSKPLYMPAWGDILSEKQRWDALAYIRSLARTNGKEQAGNREDKILASGTP